MLTVRKSKYTTYLFFVCTGIILLSFSLHRRLLKFPTLEYICQKPTVPEYLLENLEDIRQDKANIKVVDYPKDFVRILELVRRKPQSNETELQIKKIISEIDQLVPKVNYTHMDNTTCAGKSRASILNPRNRYCVGENVTILLDMYDYLGNHKKYGGDLLRARIYSPDLGAGASGKIIDFHNGTYNIYFTLFWAGKVKMSLLLIHPSEAVAALWRGRNAGYQYIYHRAKFTSPTQQVETECGYQLDTKEEVCEYMENKDEYPFFCIKPAQMPCGSLTQVASPFTQNSQLSNLEKTLFDSAHIHTEIPHGLQDLDVLTCTNESAPLKEKCKTGMALQFPGGYFLQNVWHPISCSMQRFTSAEQINGCLKGKSLRLTGDSTMMQWMTYFTKMLPTLKDLDLYAWGGAKSLLKVDVERNIQIRFQKHGHPYIYIPFYSVLEDPTIPEQIDQVGGNKHTAITFTAGAHFRPFPLHIFIRRVINIRKAIQRLFLRSPETKVVLKTGNTCYPGQNVEKISDFNGYVQYLIMNSLLQDLNIGIVDAWDMTTAFATNDVHPPPNVIENEINLFLTFLC